MKRRIAGIILLAACATASAQIQSGTGIGSNTASGGRANTNDPPPVPTQSTGASAERVSPQSTTPRTPETPGRSSGRCDSLTGQERAQCLREQAGAVRPPPASTGSTGPGSTGTGSGAVK